HLVRDAALKATVACVDRDAEHLAAAIDSDVDHHLADRALHARVVNLVEVAVHHAGHRARAQRGFSTAGGAADVHGLQHGVLVGHAAASSAAAAATAASRAGPGNGQDAGRARDFELTALVHVQSGVLARAIARDGPR